MTRTQEGLKLHRELEELASGKGYDSNPGGFETRCFRLQPGSRPSV
jgi:hypothetical protein